MPMLRLLIPLLILLSTLCNPPHTTRALSTQEKRVSIDVQNIMWWFPEDTETVTVARGPFKLKIFDRNPVRLDVAEAFRQISIGDLTTLKRGKISKLIDGQTILLSVEGSRKFSPPTSLGGMRYEGCSVTCFDRDFSSQREPLLRSLQDDAKQVKNINGHRVFLFNETLE